MKTFGVILMIVGFFTIPFGVILIGIGWMIYSDSESGEERRQAERNRERDERERLRKFRDEIEKQKRIEAALQKLIGGYDSKIQEAATAIKRLIKEDRFINRGLWEDTISNHRDTFEYISEDGEILQKQLTAEDPVREPVRLCLEVAQTYGKFIDKRNSSWIAQEINKMDSWFQTVDEKPLTRRQKRAVVSNEDANLVVAAAGSGKTTVVCTRVGYLLERGLANPNEILVLAFARQARDELEERIKQKFNVGLEVRTFHSLGLSILGEAAGKVPSLDELAEQEYKLENFIEEFVDEMLSDDSWAKLLNNYFSYFITPCKTRFDFDDEKSYKAFLKSHGLVTLNGERVKGFGELSIANFLFRNGIEYEYEAKYHAADLATKIHRQYKPDFFLPKYNIYIEHFGIDENGGTAPGIDASKYRDSMEWKRRVHQKNETILIESYHHQLLKMVLLKKLRDNLLEQKVEFAPLSKEQLKEHLLKTGEIRRFTVLVKSFLNLYKSQNLELSDLIRASELIADLGRTKLFLKIFEKFYKRYSQHLNKNGNIDFHDMIKLAAQQVKNQEFVSPYKHIIVDEFQDISHCRATLIKELLDSKSDTRLFCVGDDWQSIYRFTGSDVSLMTRFSDHFGHAARIDLDKTFRFNDKLVSASTKFVTGNPQQLKKVISANREIVVPPIHVLAANPEEEATSPLFNALRQISERDPQASVLILARYNFMLRDLPQNLSNSFPLLQISLKTSHASKGQEADYVIGVGLVSGKHGFPSEIVDDPILDVVMPEGEGFANAEERRLFYVTITRARHEVFLLTEASSPSKFIQELESKEYREFVDSELCEKDYPICRVCGSSLVERNSINGKFWGCMNYPYCDGLGVSCPSCEIGVLVNINGHGACTDEDCSYTTLVCHGIGCNGFFLPRNGKFGPFYGCSNYPDCKCTRDRLPEGFAGSTK